MVQYLGSHYRKWTCGEGKWLEDEVAKLKDAVLKYGGKKWKKIAELVESRTDAQYRLKWKELTLKKKKTPALGQDPHSL
jgi:hypothetical protein